MEDQFPIDSVVRLQNLTSSGAQYNDMAGIVKTSFDPDSMRQEVWIKELNTSVAVRPINMKEISPPPHKMGSPLRFPIGTHVEVFLAGIESNDGSGYISVEAGRSWVVSVQNSDRGGGWVPASIVHQNYRRADWCPDFAYAYSVLLDYPPLGVSVSVQDNGALSFQKVFGGNDNYDDEHCYIPVREDDERCVRILLEPGMEVTLFGLNSRTDLNGKTATIIKFKSSSSITGRYQVKLTNNGETVAVKRANISINNSGGSGSDVDDDSSSDNDRKVATKKKEDMSDDCCAHCGKTNPQGECDLCKTAYCDRKCQKSNWQYHKVYVCEHSKKPKEKKKGEHLVPSSISCEGWPPAQMDPMECRCGSAECTYQEDGFAAVYMNMSGKSCFLGMVRLSSGEVLKLDDPDHDLIVEDNDWASAGHFMTRFECVSEWSYCDSPIGKKFHTDYDTRDIGSFLVDYSGRENDSAPCNTMYPFYTDLKPPYKDSKPPKIRADDVVTVVFSKAFKLSDDLLIAPKERVQVYVASLTASGIVTGYIETNMHQFECCVYFPSHHVLRLVKRGMHWK